MSDNRLPPPVDDAPKIYPVAHGIETTVYKFDTSKPADSPPKPSGSSARLYHGCGGEWTFSGITQYVDGATWYSGKCDGCGAYGRTRACYPVTT